MKATQKWIEGMLAQVLGGLPALDWGSLGDLNVNGGDDLGLVDGAELVPAPAS